jgi:hypothetical protein
MIGIAHDQTEGPGRGHPFFQDLSLGDETLTARADSPTIPNQYKSREQICDSFSGDIRFRKTPV